MAWPSLTCTMRIRSVSGRTSTWSKVPAGGAVAASKARTERAIRFTGVLLFGHGDDVVLGAEVQDVLGNGAAGHEDFAGAVARQQVVAGPRLEDEDLALLAGEIDLPAGRDRGGGESGRPPTRARAQVG